MTYGDVAEYVEAGSGRVVGNVLSRYGHEVPWWRVILASGRPAPGHATEQLEHLVAEGVPVRIGTGRVDLARARWDGRG
jgi:alkylated DNA nucleotide flippase Atl1